MAGERRRRERITKYINELAQIVPGSEKSKGSIVQCAVQYITQLRDNETRDIEQWVLEKATIEQIIDKLSSIWESVQADCQLAWSECEKWKKAAAKAGISIDSLSHATDKMSTPGLINPNISVQPKPKARLKPTVGPKQWRSMTNDHGSKLQIENPEQYTLEELKWINQHHSTNDPSQLLNIIHQETEVPKDPRTKIMDTFHYWCWQNTQKVQGYEPPEWFKRDYNLRKVAADQEKAKWQPKQPEAEKRAR